ncbi:MAG: hypothetical protein FWD82_03805 [Defluviitaleaceae bacterium]|nr:hypothetical protein [Defluviitaleaceae bacterium]
METNKNEKYFDERLISPEIKAIKVAIPYLSDRHQKVLAPLIKVIEAKSIIQKYSVPNYEAFENKSHSPKDMLIAIKPHVDENKQQIIDMFIKIINTKETIDLIKVMESD